MRTWSRTALVGAAATAAWSAFATDALPARVGAGAVVALLPAVTVAGHLRSRGHRRSVVAVLAGAAAAATLGLVAGLASRLGTEGAPALVAVVLTCWAVALVRSAGADDAAEPAEPAVPFAPVDAHGPLLPAPAPVPAAERLAAPVRTAGHAPAPVPAPEQPLPHVG